MTEKASASPPRDSVKIYRRLFAYVRPYLWMLIVGMAASIVASQTDALFARLMKPLTDQGFSGKGDHPLWYFPAAIVGLFAIRGVFTFINSYAMSYLSNQVLAKLRSEMFDRILTLPTQYFDDHASSSLVSRIVFEASNAMGTATSVITNVVRNGFTVLFLVGYLVTLNWRLTLFSVVLLPVVTVIVRRFSGRMRALSRANLHMTGELTRVVQETIDCQKVVKVYGGETEARGLFTRTIERLRGNQMRITVASSGTVPITQLFSSLALAGVIYFALRFAATGQMTSGDFISFMIAMVMLLAPLKQLADISGPLERGLAAAEGVFSLIDEIPEDDRGTIELTGARGRLTYEAVSLRYPAAQRDALSEVSLDIRAGETLALVGPSGGGKTSLANLVPRFYHASAGRILLDGVPIEEIRIASLRSQIAMVSQDVVLFNDTIAANIAYGGTRMATPAQIRAAAQAANLLDFVDELPQGMDTFIGENGVRLSGGQRQRLAIARAVLKNAPILILDEATSALDSESERHVQAALDRLMQNRTTLVIAHRLSTIERANRIAVMDRGRLVELGSHQELMKLNGVYAKLYRIQYEHASAMAAANA